MVPFQGVDEGVTVNAAAAGEAEGEGTKATNKGIKKGVVEVDERGAGAADV